MENGDDDIIFINDDFKFEAVPEDDVIFIHEDFDFDLYAGNIGSRITCSMLAMGLCTAVSWLYTYNRVSVCYYKHGLGLLAVFRLTIFLVFIADISRNLIFVISLRLGFVTKCHGLSSAIVPSHPTLPEVFVGSACSCNQNQ